MSDERDRALIAAPHNAARYAVERRAVSWMLLALTIGFGIWGYRTMPQQKDPTIPVRVALAVTPWPGADARQIEQEVTRAVEQAVAGNPNLHPPEPTKFGLRSWSLPGISLVQISLDEDVSDTEQEFSDIELRLDALDQNLPKGAGPVQWHSGVGETAALMLTLASPIERETALALRARTAREAITNVRASVPEAAAAPAVPRATLLVMLPYATPTRTVDAIFAGLARELVRSGAARDPRSVHGDAFAGLDVTLVGTPGDLLDFSRRWLGEQLGVTSFHPDAWEPIVVVDLADLDARIAAVAGPKYSHHQLADFADYVSRGLERVPQASKVLETGVVDERIFLVFSQEKLASLGLSLQSIPAKLASQNSLTGSGNFELGASDVPVIVDSATTPEAALGGLVVAKDRAGAPVRLSSLGELYRGYQSPPTLLNSYGRFGPAGGWIRTPAVTLSIQMRPGEQIGEFGAEVDRVLDGLKARLPEDLVIARTSDQPRQVRESVALFLEALYEAIALVVVIAFVGFRDWRASLLLMVSIPLTLALTFGAASALGLTIQQVSIASLIIALGLLVDDPVVASDAIKRSLADGHRPAIAAWLGPTKLARAILFATVTNVIAYLPFVLLTGDTGDFLYSLPIMMACALIASRVVSMSFVPFLGQFVLRAPTSPEPGIEERARHGFTGWYARMVGRALASRVWVLVVAVALMVAAFGASRGLQISFFPEDVQYLASVDVWLPADASVPGTAAVADQAADVIRAASAQARTDGITRGELVSITQFAGGGGPRFWQTLTPEPTPQANYAQLVIEIDDKDDMPRLAPHLQRAVSAKIPGAHVDVRQLETNPLEYPVAVQLSARTAVTADDALREERVLRARAAELVDILRSAPSAERVRDDWFPERYTARVSIDDDRASVAGVTHSDVAHALQAAMNGVEISAYREGDERIPVVARLAPSERPQLASLGNVYVYGETPENRIPLAAVADVELDLGTERIARLDHFRTISVYGYPREGRLASQVMKEVEKPLAAFAARLPEGFQLEVGGETAKARKGFRNLAMILAVSACGIFVALVFQFQNLVKPLIVLAGVPFGFAGGLLGLVVMGESFSFMAFLGLVALVGVIVSHVIVLFDFIEELRHEGLPLEEALVTACVLRLRPVLITVAATVFALVPLALHGGPLWQGLCYAQIGGLSVATAISLLIVPVIYAICVEDLRIIRWQPDAAPGQPLVGAKI